MARRPLSPKNARKAEEEYLRRMTKKVFEPTPGIEVPRAGSNRRRIKIPPAFHHTLTERQRTVLKGKARQGRGWTRMMNMIEETGQSLEEFVQQLDVEELVKGRLKDKNGGWSGRPPKWVPREFHRACMSELMRRGRHMWQENYLTAIEAMTDIAAGRGPAGEVATPGERLKAAQFVVERMEGKVPERLVVTEDKRWATVMDGIVAEVPQEAIERGRRALEGAQGIIVDGEVVEEDKEPAPVRRRRRTAR